MCYFMFVTYPSVFVGSSRWWALVGSLWCVIWGECGSVCWWVLPLFGPPVWYADFCFRGVFQVVGLGWLLWCVISGECGSVCWWVLPGPGSW